MFLKSKRWRMVSAFGHGVLASIILAKLVRLGGDLVGRPISYETSGSIFLIGSLVIGSTAAFLCGRYFVGAAPAKS